MLKVSLLLEKKIYPNGLERVKTTNFILCIKVVRLTCLFPEYTLLAIRQSKFFLLRLIAA